MSTNRGSNRPEWLWTPDDTDVEDQAPDFSGGLVSLGFIRVAIRRSARFCVIMAAVGMVIGAALRLSSPPSYQASTTLYLSVGPEATPGTAIANDQAVVQSRAVAGLALHKLGLQETPESFLASYAATPLTDRVIVITVNAPSSAAAVSRANAVAAAFLQYSASQLEIQQRLLFQSLDQQVAQAKQQITPLDQQISQLSAQPASPARQARLNSLRTQRSEAIASLGVLAQSNNSQKASTQETTAAEIKQSQVLDAAVAIPPHSRLKYLVLYAVTGLFAGLMLALAIVIIRALTSERLYRRDDVARALGAPVKLSIGKVRLSRWRAGRKGLAAAEDPGIPADRRPAAEHGRGQVPRHPRPRRHTRGRSAGARHLPGVPGHLMRGADGLAGDGGRPLPHYSRRAPLGGDGYGDSHGADPWRARDRGYT